MRLSEIVSAAGLHVYAEIALILFLMAFVVVLFDVVAKRHVKDFDHASSLPLEDGSPAPGNKETNSNGR